MGFWKVLLQATGTAIEPTSNARLQIRYAGDNYWRDAGFIAPNSESVMGAIALLSDTNPGANVRAIDSAGRLIDYR